jgi:two-component system chemotaxis response regulator CheB
MGHKPIRVLVVDDSALMRRMITDILSSDPQLQVVDTAEDPYVAREKIKRINPDVITLDVEMPRMHGLDFLEKIMKLRPMPVVMISSLTTEGAEVTLRALELGAVDFIGKPTDWEHSFEEKRQEIISKVKAAAKARVRPLRNDPAAIAPSVSHFNSNGWVVAMGASTGGVEALGQVLTSLPSGSPPILIAQHMPERFVPFFVQRLNSVCQIRIAEAVHGQLIQPGHAYISPGSMHLQLAGMPGSYRCQLHDGERVSGHRPSVDVLFRSFADKAGAGAVGVILTGMGRDGAEGLLAMRQAGAHTIGQDESSSLIYGMPKVAFEVGAVQEQLPLRKVVDRVLQLCSQEHVAG